MTMKADLHVHSKYSDRPTEWFLRRIGAPECFTEPAEVYRICKQKGMDYVTISDHNCIRGALEIAHLPDAFISAELTTYFPEDGCKVHCLVQEITEAQFEDLQKLRQNIYELRRYLAEQSIPHVIAHPLFRVNDKLTVEHIEKLLLLFDRFEAINGSRHPRAGDLTAVLFSQLTPARIEEMANRHGIRPFGAEPWVKRFTGGSDDHSGVYTASAYTLTPAAGSVREYLDHLRAGRHEPGGTSGTSLRLAHSLYHIAYLYYRSRIMNNGAGASVVGEIIKRLVSGYEEPEKSSGLIRAWAEKVVRRYRLSKLGAGERLLVESFAKLRHSRSSSGPDQGGKRIGPDMESFATASRISHELGYAFLKQFSEHVGEGRVVDGFQTLASLGTVMLGIAPYLTAFGAQHKDERFLQEASARLGGSRVPPHRSNRRAWVTDTFSDVNGVAYTIRMFTAKARERGWPITVMTSLETLPDAGPEVVNFKPVGSFSLPEYDSQKLVFPPFLDVVEAMERGNYFETIISTPGPMGLTALLAGRLLGLRLAGIYHTDFPKYVKCLTQDEVLEQLAWRYMQWFYGQMDTIYVPSEYYRRQLTDNGFEEDKLKVLPRGVDLVRFNPRKRDPHFWTAYGLNGNLKLLYVGRVSKEKNVRILIDAFKAVRETTPDLDLVVIGGGPELEGLRRQAPANVYFTGFLQGEALSTAYASADLFVFPSDSDTFGNVVLEAHASGLPAIVSNQGGPAEIVRRHGSGLAVDVRTPASLGAGILDLVRNSDRRAEMSRRALETARELSWDRALDHF